MCECVCVCCECHGVYVHTSHAVSVDFFHHVFHPGPSSSFPPSSLQFSCFSLRFPTLQSFSVPVWFSALCLFCCLIHSRSDRKSQTLFSHSKSEPFPLRFPHFTWGMAGRCKQTQPRCVRNSFSHISDSSEGKKRMMGGGGLTCLTRSGLTVVCGCRMLTGSVFWVLCGISLTFSAMKLWTPFSASTVPWIRHTRSVVPACTLSPVIAWRQRTLIAAINLHPWWF